MTLMKSLTRIRLINWHLFADATISCQGTTYFIGINGAGKSTILDAVQFALVGGQREVKFNQAALAGGKRSLGSYVRGELGTEGQPQLRESFPAKVVKGLAFTPLTDIRGFVHGYLLDENLVNVHDLQEQLETLHHFEGLAADIRERIAALDRVAELDQERLAQRRRRLNNGFVRPRAQADQHGAQLQARQRELEETRLALARARAARG